MAPLLRDPQAEIIADALRPAMLASGDRLHQRLARFRLTKQLKVYLACRARRFGALRWFRRFELFRKSQWLVRYRLR